MRLVFLKATEKAHPSTTRVGAIQLPMLLLRSVGATNVAVQVDPRSGNQEALFRFGECSEDPEGPTPLDDRARRIVGFSTGRTGDWSGNPGEAKGACNN